MGFQQLPDLPLNFENFGNVRTFSWNFRSFGWNFRSFGWNFTNLDFSVGTFDLLAGTFDLLTGTFQTLLLHQELTVLPLELSILWLEHLEIQPFLAGTYHLLAGTFDILAGAFGFFNFSTGTFEYFSDVTALDHERERFNEVWDRNVPSSRFGDTRGTIPSSLRDNARPDARGYA